MMYVTLMIVVVQQEEFMNDVVISRSMCRSKMMCRAKMRNCETLDLFKMQNL